MPTQPLSDEKCIEAVRALHENGGVKAYAAKALGLNHNTYDNRLKKAAKRGLMGYAPVLPGFRVSKTTTVRDADGNTLREFISQKPDTGEKFKVPTGYRIKGESAYLDQDGRILNRWVKTGEAERDQTELIEEVRAAFAEIDGAANVQTPTDSDDDLMTVYVLPDLHLGMKAWRKEAGADYDLKIASEMVRREIARLVSMSPPSRNAVVIFLGDLFHQNDQTNMTPRSGHQLDVDGRWRHVYGVGARLARDLTNYVAEHHHEVEVAILPGNHDQDAAVTLAVAFELFYSEHERITVAGQPGEHWYKRFGKCLLGANHGHRMKPDRMAMMLATDRPEDWGATTFRHFFFGHVHRESAMEAGPVRVESFNSPAAKDAYAAASGYRSGRALNAVTFHRERGEVCRHRVNITQ